MKTQKQILKLVALTLTLSASALAGDHTTPSKKITRCKLPPNNLVGETSLTLKQELESKDFYIEAHSPGIDHPEYSDISTVSIINRSKLERSPQLLRYLELAGLKPINVLSAREYRIEDGSPHSTRSMGLITFKGGRGAIVGQVFFLEDSSDNYFDGVKCK